MTLRKLHAILSKLLKRDPYLARWRVTVNKPTFRHPCETDGCVYLDVNGVASDIINVCDGDGGTKLNRDGSEATNGVVVLYGESGCKHGRYHRDGECSMCAAEREDGR